mgnify:CR=1 FL=1|tara:strand:+ start:86 stop:340 length:255 start_codon:yes stop_codon:yes gene_type:complete
MDLLIVGIVFGALFGFSAGLLFNNINQASKRKRQRAVEQHMKDRMYLTIKELELEKLMYEMSRKEEKNNIIPFKKRTEDDKITE